MNSKQIFLIISAVGLLPLALFYGYEPQVTLDKFLEVSVDNTNGIHIFRALMGLYLGFSLFWIIGAFQIKLQQVALYSVMVFMLGLAAGRGISLILDGIPNWILVTNFVLELAIGSIATVFALKEIK